MKEQTAAGIKVTVPLLAGMLIYASRFARRVGLQRFGAPMFKRAAEMSPGLRAQVWKEVTHAE